MGHDKLRKFAENETFTCLLQPDASLVLDKSGDPSEGLRLNDHPIKGRWNGEMFHNDHPEGDGQERPYPSRYDAL